MTQATETTEQEFDVDSYLKAMDTFLRAAADLHNVSLPDDVILRMAFDAVEWCQRYTVGETIILAESTAALGYQAAFGNARPPDPPRAEGSE
jgi:hypothetical protein